MNSIVRSICILTLLTQCSAYGMIAGGTPATQAGLFPTMQPAPAPYLTPYQKKIGLICAGTTCALGGMWYLWRSYKQSCRHKEEHIRKTAIEELETRIKNNLLSGGIRAHFLAETIKNPDSTTLPTNRAARMMRLAMQTGSPTIVAALLERYPATTQTFLEQTETLKRARDHYIILCEQAQEAWKLAHPESATRPAIGCIEN